MDRLEIAAAVEALEPGWEGLHPLNDAIHDLMPEPKVIVSPDYLRSLDAAMTLVPEGGFGSLIVGRYPNGSAGFAAVVTKPGRGDTQAATPALALCAAALRAGDTDATG